MKIGVFDSGIGGLSVARSMQIAYPNDKIIFKNDSQHVPYGTRSPDEIFGFVVPILESLVQTGCQIIIIACNTVSTTLISKLRKQLTVPLIAMEPMVKPAALLTKTGVIAVCATPLTLASPRYAWLKATYAKQVTVLEPDCKDWSTMIERKTLDHQKIASRIREVIDQRADVIVLGCTHYHWIEAEINAVATPVALVIQPESAIIRQFARVRLSLEADH